MKTEIIKTEAEIFQTALQIFAQIIAREIIKDRQATKGPPSPDPPEDLKKRRKKCQTSA